MTEESSELPHDIREHLKILNEYLQEAATRGYLVVLDAHEKEMPGKEPAVFLEAKIYERK